MAAEPINLNRARKLRARQSAKLQADSNAVKFARSKAERDRDDRKADQDARHLDNHRTEKPE